MLLRLPPTLPATFGLSVAGWVLLDIARTAARVAAAPRPPLEAAIALGRTLAANAPWMLATPFLLLLAERLPWQRGSRLRTLGLHLAVLAVWSVLEAAWAWSVLVATGVRMLAGPPVWYLTRLEQTAFLYLCLLAIGIAIRQRRRLDAAVESAARLESRLQQARLHVLSLQLHPHFLFNTLNAVSELVHRDAAAARRMLTGLGELLRRSLDDDTPQEVTLDEELALLERYLDIQRVRFAGALRIDVIVAPAARTATLPRLALQPLVENAIRHGTARRAGPGRIAVRARVIGQRLEVEIEDDGPGPGLRVPVREGVGLGNTRARLRELYGAEATLTLSAAPDRGAVLRLECPVRYRGQAAGEPLTGGEESEFMEQDNPTLPRLAATVVLAWLLAGVLGGQADFLGARLMGEPEPFGAVLRSRLGQALLWLGLTPPVLWAARRLAIARLSWWRLAAAHLGLAAAACAIHVSLTVRLVSPGLDPGLVAVTLVMNLSIYAALAALGHAWSVRTEAAAGRAAAARLEGELAAARLELLRWRLHPDLVFRALERIGQLAARDPAAADELTGTLGDLLRRLLSAREGSRVSLRSELELLAAYSTLRGTVGLPAPPLELELAPGAEDVWVAAMLLQPLAEVLDDAGGTPLALRGSLRDGRLVLVIKGNAVLADHPAMSDLGRRLAMSYGDTATLNLVRAGHSATFTLAVPAARTWQAA